MVHCELLKDNMPKQKEETLDSILDLNPSNVWNVSEAEIAELWDKEKKEDSFPPYEEKLLNIIRLAYEVVHFDNGDERDVLPKDDVSAKLLFNAAHDLVHAFRGRGSGNDDAQRVHAGRHVVNVHTKVFEDLEHFPRESDFRGHMHF